MAKFVTFDTPTEKDLQENPLKTAWESIRSSDKFSKMFLLSALLLLITVPYIVNNLQIFNPQAQEQSQVKVVDSTGTPITSTTDINTYVKIGLGPDWVASSATPSSTPFS